MAADTSHGVTNDRREADASERDRLFELSLDLLCTANVDGYLTRVNPAFERTLGHSAEELTSIPFIEFVHPDDREATLAELEKLAGGATTIDFENRYRCADGSFTWLAWRAVPVPEEGLVFAVARDITARKEIEQERKRLLRVLEAQNDRLRKLDRLRNDMLAAVTHELKTPVGSIRGFISLVLAGKAGEVDPVQREYLEVAQRNCERLLRLVGDLLLVAQAEAGQLDLRLGEVDLARIARESVESARVRAAEQHVVLECVEGALPSVTGDPERLAQLADNLVGNAVKFTPPGGRVDVAVGVDRGRVRLTVSDSGIGISEEDQARIFDPFYRAVDPGERTMPGTGLGLAISKAIVDGHAGAIEVSSREGHGTTFTVTLPLRAELPAVVAV
jgi:PAS domain S-box-containing protein